MIVLPKNRIMIFIAKNPYLIYLIFFTFIFYGLLTWGAFSAIKFTMVDPNKNNSYTDFHLGVKDIFYLCSLLSSSDIIAAVTLVKYSE